ncbi:MAG: DnaB-like helicase C-terminal domain-containing protein [Lachnospiraceae bacterium]|nr:DnaB-like helicase C-terminal domain-containing protein [Lachnospiraceae bacterium]
MVIKNYEEVIEKLKTKYVDYLEEKNINTKRPFPCLDPDHDDKHGSMALVPHSNFTRAHCFACGAIADIFDAVHIIDGKPKNGPQYIEETVMWLANKYGIQAELKELTDEEKYRISCLNAYKEAAKYVAANPSPAALDEIKRREWDPEGAKLRLIGGVPSFNDYKAHMKAQGFAVSFMEDIDLMNPYMFNENALIFTISDNHGRPCGFSARNLDYDKNSSNDRNRTKYINTSAKCPIYEKSKRLYNLHNTGIEKGTVYIVEGCSATEAMVQHGIINTVGIGGTAFTDYHAIELARTGRTNITIVTDPDEAGMKAADRIIEKLSDHRDFSIYLISLPDGLDPDDFMRANGPQEFHKLKRWSAFEWKISSYDSSIDSMLIRKEVVPIIAAESSPIEREKMIDALSERVDISADAIKEEVRILLDAAEQKQQAERDAILKTLMVDLRTSPTDWRHILADAQNHLETVSEKTNEDCFSPQIFVKEIEFMREEQESLEEKGMTCNFYKWKEFQNAIEGNHEATLNVIGGSANTGKTAMMSGLALQLADIPDDLGQDYFVVFQTIDDTLKQFTNRIVTQMALEKYKDITLNMVTSPNKYQQARIINEARRYAYQKLEMLIKKQKILIRSGEEKGGATLSYADQMIKYAKKARPEATVVYFLDNFHRLKDFAASDERTRFKKLSNAAKDLSKYHKIPIWATMEYNKTVGTGRPTNNSISESIAMEYDANLIMHLYNDMHVKNQMGEEPEIFFSKQDTEGRWFKAPRIEAIIGKNKLNSFKGSLYFDFHAEQSRMEPVSSSIVQSDVERIRVERGSQKMNNGPWKAA